MKREKVLFIVSTVMMVVASITTVFAATYLYNSADVSYDNSVSHLDSTDVQGAIDELYGHSTDYTNANSRISTLESYFGTDPKARFAGYNVGIGNGGDTTTPRAYQLYRGTTVKGDFQYYPQDDTVYLNARNNSGTSGTGNLALVGSTVKINNIDIAGIGTIASSNSGAKTCTNNSNDTVTSITLDPGKWIISFAGTFENNVNGRRGIRLGTGSNNSTYSDLTGISVLPPAQYEATFINSTRIANLSSSTTLYLKLFQNSGGSLSCEGLVQAIKIAN